MSAGEYIPEPATRDQIVKAAREVANSAWEAANFAVLNSPEEAAQKAVAYHFARFADHLTEGN